jgi:hypothetical protein
MGRLIVFLLVTFSGPMTRLLALPALVVGEVLPVVPTIAA